MTASLLSSFFPMLFERGASCVVAPPLSYFLLSAVFFEFHFEFISFVPSHPIKFQGLLNAISHSWCIKFAFFFKSRRILRLH